jgi:hypothetical protein
MELRHAARQTPSLAEAGIIRHYLRLLVALA